jgi:hypothetical protein
LTGTCGQGCETCTGMVRVEIDPGNFMVSIGMGQQLAYVLTDTFGNRTNYTNSSNWSSNQTQVMTVQTMGQSSAGMTAGVGEGSAGIQGELAQQVPLNAGQICAFPQPSCPTVQNPGAQASGSVATLLCSPSPITRGSTITCTVTGDSVASWSFSAPGIQINGPAGTNPWSGTMVMSGTVTATGAKLETLTASVTVNPRPNFSTVTLPAAGLVANGSTVGSQTLPTLASPPDTSEGALGQSAYGTEYTFKPAAVTSGPNNGLIYITSVTDASSFGWELNPGLTNANDPFYLHQGNCFPSVSTIVAAVKAHEVGLPGPSHYSQAKDSLARNNPGTAAEVIVATNTNRIDDPIQAAYQAAVTAAGVEPPTNLPANINYPPYRICQ